MMPLQIAIDGPVAAGKGDIAARLAGELGLLYIYTGGFYRALAYACHQAGISTKDKDGVLSVLKQSQIDQVEQTDVSEMPYVFLVNGRDVTSEIFAQDMGASDVAVIPEVRQQLVKRQKEIAKEKKVVMEGRDIGLRVLPDAQLKIYLTASVEERARRRWEQQKTKGIQRSFEEVLEETKKRDAQDTGRESDPLQKLPDAWELDTTGLSQDQVVEKIKEELIYRHLI
jgi:cytidylate kinase